MKAIIYKKTREGTVLAMSDVPKPDLPGGSLRIKVHASSINRADYLSLRGKYPKTEESGKNIAGIDAAGEVIEVSPDVTDFSVGDRIMAMVPGGLAEEIVVPSRSAVLIPTSWSYAEGAASIVALMTEHNALVTSGRIRHGDRVLIHAAASGVGSQAVGLANILGAGSIFGTTRSEHPELPFHSMEHYHSIRTTEENFADFILEETCGTGVDLIIDHVGGPYLSDNIRAAAVGCRLISVGRLGGREGIINLEEVARKRMEIIGVTFRTRTQSDKERIVSDLGTGIDLQSFANDLRPLIDRILPWASVIESQMTPILKEHVGKIVLTLPD